MIHYSAVFLLVVLLFSAVRLDAQEAEPVLMPWPEKIEMHSGRYRIDSDLLVAVDGEVSGRLARAATRFLRRLDDRTGLFFAQDVITPDSRDSSAAVRLICDRTGQLELFEDESYRLIISPAGVELNAVTDIGILRGLETLLQCVAADEQGYYLPALRIHDAPRFPWRGLMLDVCRHFMPLEVIKRNLDGMAMIKMNVFHWHLSEDQGFRIESKTFPKLHEMGSDGFYFTHEQVKEVIAYAADRGIRVIPEFDMPGHATSWFVGYPELASAPGPYEIIRTWGIMDPVMNPMREETYEFLDRFLAEMTDLFPDDYFHIGGDENNGKQWDANLEIQAYMQEQGIADNHALQMYFNNRVLEMLNKYGKKMVGWDEILHPGMPKTIVIQSWRGKEALIRAAQEGYRSILSNGYYIDLIQPTDFHYSNDPLPADAPLTAEQAERILGGEATSWAELVTPETVDSRIWPRTAAIAERLWSPREVTDVDNMYRRLERISYLLESAGLTHLKNSDMMLRRLADGGDIRALRTLIDVLEPVKIYTRHRQGKTFTSYSPYTRAADAARPDQPTARKFRRLVADFLEQGDAAQAAEIRSHLQLWHDNDAALQETFGRSPIIRDVQPLSKNLALISEHGLQALDRLSRGKREQKKWLDKAMADLEEATKPAAECELMVVSAVRALVEAAAK
ncbi:family 20 glycosylhydrolase [candidate division KSB1 bacterium]|nr:family 20 glycosylhydrolase [candidate division KSB1 bacterium]